MIVSDLNDSSRIVALHPLFAKLFDYVAAHNLLDAPLGRIELEGERLFINNVEPECVERDKQLLEVHHKYIDVHFLLRDNETIGWKATREIKGYSKPYNEEGDYAMSDERPTTFVDLLPGQFAVLFPEDAHAPLIGEGLIRKAIAKVMID